MTKFILMEPIAKPERKKTVFYKFVSTSCIETAEYQPNDYHNVMFLWHDEDYGDVFIAWYDNPSNRTIFFGTKGDEFDQE